ncbi:MAG: hypothetical protein A3J38_08285 [Gammaproteobacteria bacterium RIFCSPHIGHO2_12_FULL_45_9]|nr:MAG: hypothetical protein A3J38_08285 [Gammaproteobacteria bacterium RIFCSPHIGHO2_12_FULL_45_9]
MRLSDEYISVIVCAAHQQFGDDVQVWLFGSRVDETRRGGDIDLMIEVKHRVANKPHAASEFAASLQYQLGDQKIDVIIDDGYERQPIHAVVRQEGRRL